MNYFAVAFLALLCATVEGHCPGEYGVNECDAHSDFKTVPTQYADLPILDLQTKWAPLIPLKEFEQGSDITLELTPAYYLGPSYNTAIMTYNGIAPPPIIRLKAGDNFKLTLQNGMGDSMGVENYNDYQFPNTTSLHLHGMHISGGRPGDEVGTVVNPGQAHEYYYEVNPNHSPGANWYHPHFHGSTSLQTGQGVAGMIIVEDPPGYLPDQIANMPEINMMLQHMGLEDLHEAANVSGSVVFEESSMVFGNATTETGNTNLLLVNMQYVPKISVERGKWYRMRMVMSSIEEGLAWEAPEGCDLQLLAKDGIYLSDAPRSVRTMILAPGNRADVAIMCDTEPGVYKMPAVSRGRYFEYNTEGSYSDECEWCLSQPNVAVLEVVSSESGVIEAPLEPFGATLRRPCYVSDLTGLSAEQVGTEYKLDYGPDDTVNGVAWGDEPRYAVNYTVGSVQQIYLDNNGKHPHHQHVNPFQILEIINRTDMVEFEDWYRDGDWHDVLQHITKKSKPRIRWTADDFTGDMLFHCHILSHGDKGMMGQFSLEGESGTEYYGAQLRGSCVSNSQYLVDPGDDLDLVRPGVVVIERRPIPMWLGSLCTTYYLLPWC